MTLAITNGTIIDGRGNDPLTGMTILIEDARITALGRSNSVTIPHGTQVIDARGGSILPGLIDTHVHFTMEYPDVLRGLLTPPSLRLFQAIPRMRATLEAGVTTVRDAAGAPAGLKMAVERGIVAGPRMQVAITLISQTGGHGDGFYPCCVDIGFFGGSFTDVPRGVADGVDEVRKAVREVLRAGADWIKLATTGGVLSTSDAPTSSQLTIEEIATAVYEAAAQEKRCMAHAQGTQGIKNALLAGVVSIEHGVYLTDELIELMLERDAFLVPTLIAPISVVEFSKGHPDLLPPMMAEKAVSVIERHKQSFRMAVEAGVKIAMGTDAGNIGTLHGPSVFREMALMQQAGLTPLEVLRSATVYGAKAARHENDVGIIDTGRFADMVLLDADPLIDVTNLSRVYQVIKGGSVFDPDELIRSIR